MENQSNRKMYDDLRHYGVLLVDTIIDKANVRIQVYISTDNCMYYVLMANGNVENVVQLNQTDGAVNGRPVIICR